MLLVAGSGVIGRHIYANIHRGLYGRKTTLNELRNDLNKSLENNQGLAILLPKFTAQLTNLAADMQGSSITGTLSTGASVIWSFKKYYIWSSLLITARRELRAQAAISRTVAKDKDRLNRVVTTYIRRYVKLIGRVSQFTLYERLFSLWHILHMPFFFMMIVSALFHVLAVHMY